LTRKTTPQYNSRINDANRLLIMVRKLGSFNIDFIAKYFPVVKKNYKTQQKII
jgi:hypothetical protein